LPDLSRYASLCGIFATGLFCVSCYTLTLSYSPNLYRIE
jgi:hypothetical protein